MTGRIFQASLLVATLLPFLTVALPRSSTALAVWAGISVLGGTHVMATTYLYTTPHAFAGIPGWKWSCVVAPIILMASVFLALMAFPAWALGAFMLVYVHFGIWHFGRQNLGVMTFSTRIGKGRPMSKFERMSIMIGVVAGMCAAYTAFAPALMLNPGWFPVDTAWAAPFFTRLWYVGAAIFVALVPTALTYAIVNRAQFDVGSFLLYLTSVLFFAPLFLASDPMIAVASWAVAHGLQYLVFLAFHAGGLTRPTLRGILPPVALIAAAGAGYLLWNTYPSWGGSLRRSVWPPFLRSIWPTIGSTCSFGNSGHPSAESGWPRAIRSCWIRHRRRLQRSSSRRLWFSRSDARTAGSPAWIRTTTSAFKARHPAGGAFSSKVGTGLLQKMRPILNPCDREWSPVRVSSPLLRFEGPIF